MARKGTGGHKGPPAGRNRRAREKEGRHQHHAEQGVTLPRWRQNFTGVLLIVGLEEGLLHVGGDELVAAEGHREGATAAGQRAEGGAVAVHLGQGGLGFQRGVLAFGIHAHDDGTAALQVGHDATLALGRDGDGDVVDRLLDLRGSLLVLWLRTPLKIKTMK